MKKEILIIAFLSCLTGCVSDLVAFGISQAGVYVFTEGVTAIDNSNKRIEEEEAKKANQQAPTMP